MHTSVLFIALSTCVGHLDLAEAPKWQTDYAQARKVGQEAHKPLAVIVGSGATGWSDLARGGELGADAAKLLQDNYICVYVDIATPEGRRLAASLEVRNGHGLVISDRTGQLMAFHHDGDLSKSDLTSYLRKYADPERAVRSTDTNPSQRTSYYQPSAPTTYQPAPVQYYQPPAYSGGRVCTT